MQFDVYRNLSENSRKNYPYLLDVQSDLLDNLRTRVVIPLTVGKVPAKILNPVFEVEGQNVVMSTQQIVGMGIENLGEKVCSLQERRDEIISAIDFLITGF